MPQFPGGDHELLRFIAKNIKYPRTAQENGIEGRVICSFIVEKKREYNEHRDSEGIRNLIRQRSNPGDQHHANMGTGEK